MASIAFRGPGKMYRIQPLSIRITAEDGGGKGMMNIGEEGTDKSELLLSAGLCE